ncbi:FAD-dependent oxidoreductase [Streptomyces sp. NPDC053431]|uniref:FAD-dependent oxidoreductase n=1 Tax=Streptomyces sp. NPDC053431 TaxID=3365703 RepID=UPI0037CF73C4
MSVETTDVLVIGSGFGGAIPAYYLAAGGARVTVLERGPRLSAADFSHSLKLGSYNRIVDVIRGDGISVVAGNCVGGGSVVYFAASLRAPTFAFERQGSLGRRIWPADLTRSALDPWYDRVEEALPVTRTAWPDVSYAGGVLAAACHRAGMTCNPVPLAVDTRTCTNCNWMLSGCHFDAKRSLLLNYLPAAEAYGASIRPLHEVQTLSPSNLPGYRYTATFTILDPDDYSCTASSGVFHAKVIVLAAGAVGTPIILKRSALLLGGIPEAVGRYFSGNGDRVSVADIDDNKARTLLGLSRSNEAAYQALPIGRPITAATFDFLDPGKPEFSRFTLQQIYFPPIVNLLAQQSGQTHWFGISQRNLRARWRSWLTLLAMTEDDSEGFFSSVPPTGSFIRLAPGIGLGSMCYRPTARTRGAWLKADTAIRAILEKDGLAQVRPWQEEVTPAVTAHPLGSVRIGDDPRTSALTSAHELRGHPGIFVTDGSALPAALTVNPSLTIAALAERATPGVINCLKGMGASVHYGAPPPQP